MPTHTIVQADWLVDNVFLLRDRHAYPVLMTQPQGVNGSDLLPLSLIGCAAWDVLSILRKQRQAVTGLRVVADSEQEAEPPWRFRRILITYQFSGPALQAQRIQRAIELSQERYCSVYATLREAVEIESRFEIVDALPAPDDGPARVVIAFNDALNARDVDGMMRLMSQDCVFENTAPTPDGTRYEGQPAIRAFWEQFFAAAPQTQIEIEEIVGVADRCIMRWTYRWTDRSGIAGHVRGIDLYTVRQGLITEKLSYVKG